MSKYQISLYTLPKTVSVSLVYKIFVAGNKINWFVSARLPEQVTKKKETFPTQNNRVWWFHFHIELNPKIWRKKTLKNLFFFLLLLLFTYNTRTTYNFVSCSVVVVHRIMYTYSNTVCMIDNCLPTYDYIQIKAKRNLNSSHQIRLYSPKWLKSLRTYSESARDVEF